MGTSNWQNISYCCEWIYRLAPKRTLDVGIGSMGRWGSLVREFTDVWSGNALSGQWKNVIDGIEAFPDVVESMHNCIYNDIYIGDAYDVIDRLGVYDLIVLGDVIEHFPEERAAAMLRKCVRRAKTVLVSTPIGALNEWPQGEEYGNKWEVHHKVFKHEEFCNSRYWRVLEYKHFSDFRARKFGTYLLRAGWR